MSGLDLLINKLKMQGVLKSPMLELAFKSVDRKDFMLEDFQDSAYEDHPFPIGYQQTISQPFTVVFMLELLDLREDNKILDIGSGSGWTAALMAFIVSKTGSVTGVERVKELVEFGKQNIKKYHFPHTKIIKAKDSIGLEGELFDRILVSASAENFPKELLTQLDRGGKMVIPVGNSIFLFEKDFDGTVHKIEYPGFVFVPLIPA